MNIIYIEVVDGLIESNLSAIDKVKKILDVGEPPDNNWLAGLLYNKAFELKYFEQEDEGYFNSEEEVLEARLRLCEKITSTIKQIIDAINSKGSSKLTCVMVAVYGKPVTDGEYEFTKEELKYDQDNFDELGKKLEEWNSSLPQEKNGYIKFNVKPKFYLVDKSTDQITEL